MEARLRTILAAGLVALPAALAVAQGAGPAHVDPALFQELRWRMIGPFRGGRVLAVAGVPGERDHFYFGSVNGGVWVTRNGGASWTPLSDNQRSLSIASLALDPTNPNVLLAGTGITSNGLPAPAIRWRSGSTTAATSWSR